MRPKESHYLFLGLIAEELIHQRVPKIDPAGCQFFDYPLSVEKE